MYRSRAFRTTSLSLAAAAALLACGDSSAPRTPATVIAASAVEQAGTAGQPVEELPAVTVADASGQPMSGISVTFAVDSGGGSVTGGTTTTGSDGRAVVGEWVLGTAGGRNTLTASVAGLPPVKFIASAPVPCVISSMVVGTPVSGALATTDCSVSGRFLDLYTITIPAGAGLQVDMTSTVIDPFVRLLNTDRLVLAENDDIDEGFTNSRLLVIAPPGEYLVGAASYDAGEVGSYTLSAVPHGGKAENCTEIWILPGVTTEQALTDTDVCEPDFPWYYDLFPMRLRAGQQLTITMRSTALNSYVELYGPQGFNTLFNDDFEPGVSQDARITVTISLPGVYWILPSSSGEKEVGAYTLIVQ